MSKPLSDAMNSLICNLQTEHRQLKYALAESVKLQSHYAMLLNAYDGGQRMTPTDSGDWIKRLKELPGWPV